MKISVQAKYFWLAIVFVGSIGIWMPMIIYKLLDKTFTFENLPIYLTTYYVSLYFAGCVDFILKQFEDIDLVNAKSAVLNIIFLIILSFALIITTIWLTISGYFFIPIVLAVLGTLIALRLWWVNNSDNPIFAEIIRREMKSKHGNNWK